MSSLRFHLRDYQAEAAEWLQPRRRGLIHGPAGCGKTRLAAWAMIYRAWDDAHVVWISNTKEQCQQAHDTVKETDRGWTGMTIEFPCAAGNPDVSRADIIIFDEAHHLPAETWTAIMLRAKPDAIVWALTATPNHENPLRNMVMEAAFPERFVIDRARLLAAGHLVEGKVLMHDVDTPGEFNKEIEAAVVLETRRRVVRFPRVNPAEHMRRAQWQITQEFTQKNEKRNDKIVSLAQASIAESRSSLLLVHSIEHGESLVARIPGALLVHSKVGAKTRRQLISDFREGKLLCLAATSLADEGLDVPIASTLVLAAGGRSSGKLEQRAGRILRPYAGKRGGIVHDLLDRGSIFGHAQARARMKTWTKLGYNPEIVGDVLEESVPEELQPTAELAQDAFLQGWEHWK